MLRMESVKKMSFSIFLWLLFSSCALAQIGPGLPPAPVHSSVDKIGIDLVEGRPALPGMQVSIGTKESGIERDPGRDWAERDNFTGTLTETVVSNATNPFNLPVGTYIRINSIGNSEIFLVSGSTYSNFEGTGGTFSCVSTICTYTTKHGTAVQFDTTKRSGFSQKIPAQGTVKVNLKNIGLQTKIIKPNGEVIDLAYQPNLYFGINTANVTIGSVSSSLGWMLKYQYGTYVTSGSQLTGSRSIKAINTSVEYCDPGSATCDALSNAWAKATMTHKFVSTQIGSSSQYSDVLTATAINPLNRSYDYTKSTQTTQGTGKYESYRFPSGVLYQYDSPGCDYVPASGICYENENTGKVVTFSKGGTTFHYTYERNFTDPTPDGIAVKISSGPFGSIKLWDDRSIPLYDIDKLNRKTAYTYTNNKGRFIDKIIDPDATPNIANATGGYTDYDYDSRGNITQIAVYPKNGGSPLITSATYLPTCSNIKTCNKPLTITNQKGVTTTYTYDPNHGGLISETTPAVNGVQAQVRYEYQQKYPYIKNSSGTLVQSGAVWTLVAISKCMKMTLASCVGTSDEQRKEFSDFTYNLLPKQTTLRNGDSSVSLITTRDYDIYGNLSWEDGPRPGAYDRVYYFYDSLQNEIGRIMSDPDGPGSLRRQAIRMGYNADGKINLVARGVVNGTSKADLDAMASLESTETEFSSTSGLPIVERKYVSGSLDRLIQKSYDDKERLDCVAQRLNRNTYNSLPLSACTLTTTGDEGNDRITKYTYDAADAILKSTSAYATANQRDDFVKSYNALNGLLDSEADGKGNTTFYKYDNYKRPWKTVYPQPSNGAAESATDFSQTSYTGAFISSLRLRDGLVINLNGYDEAGRLKTKSGAVNESFVYDNFGQVVSHTNNTTGGVSHTSVYDFNSLGWLKSETRTAGGVTLGAVNYGYDAYGRKNRLTWPDNFYVTYDYDVSGYTGDNLQKIKESNGTSIASFTYDDSGRRKVLTRGNNVTTTFDYYEKKSLLKSLVTDVGGSASADDIAESFFYTITGQIKSRIVTLLNSGYEYGAVAAPATSYTPNALNQIGSLNGQSMGYDGRGNLTADNTGATYTYNANNLLLNSTKAGITTTLTYDTENRLHSVAKSGATAKFVYDGSNLIAETDANNNVLRRYIHGPEQSDPIAWYEGAGTSDKRFYTTDRQGSIIGVTSSSGVNIFTNAYDEYGIQKTVSIGRFQYTGQTWLSEIGLYYYKARFYNPVLGRFLQTDPIGYKDNYNLYAYVGNDPVNMNDPSGLEGACPDNDTSCIHDSASEKPGPEGGEPVTEKQREIDEIVVTAKRDKKIGSSDINMKLPYPNEQYGRVDGNKTTSVEGKAERRYSCNDGSSGASNILNKSDFSGADAALHTHPNWALGIPGPDDGVVAGSLSMTNYGITSSGIFAVENTPSGYRARLVSGKWGGSASQVKAVVAGYNNGNGSGNSSKKCSYE